MLILLTLLGCGPAEEGPTWSFPEPDAWTMTGPGGPTASFAAEELWEHCATLTGGPEDAEHHNLVVMYDGYLVLPWAPESGGGGITFYDISEPCAPVKVGEGYAPWMRESHTVAFGRVGDREYAAVDYQQTLEGGGWEGGVGFWDITDRTAPFWAGQVAVPDYSYLIDAYQRVTLSTMWQGDYVYSSGGFNGIFVIDASDPTAPVLLGQHVLDTFFLVGSFHAFGNRAMVASAGFARTVMVDISDPEVIEPVPGGDFLVTDAAGETRNYYFSNLSGRFGLFARKDTAGGPILFDVTDPSEPTFVGEHPTYDGSGGYLFRQNGELFVGDSEFASIYDIHDPTAPVELGRMFLKGDLDTNTPVGNVVVLSVDAGPEPGKATVVVPWSAEPDRVPPTVELTSPEDGATGQATTSRIGVSVDEMIEPMSVFEGSFQVVEDGVGPVEGTFSVQEALISFVPAEPLTAHASFTITLPAGGIADYSGNRLEEEVSWRFSTGAAR